MLSLVDCPAILPDYPTLDGKPIPEYLRVVPKPKVEPDWSAEQLERSGLQDRRISDICPTLVNIGLLDALIEVEAVLAHSVVGKYKGKKWQLKPISYHDAKATSHLGKAQTLGTPDEETGRSHRAHTGCRILMSLAHELKQSALPVD